jgi:hypothetical protein
MERLENGTIVLRTKEDIEEYIATLPKTKWYWKLWHWLRRDESWYIAQNAKSK